MKIFLLLLLLPVSSLANDVVDLLHHHEVIKKKSTKKDWFFNPDCQATKIWKAVAEHQNIPEVNTKFCSIMQLPSGVWVPRYDPNAEKDYVETEEEKKEKLLHPSATIEDVNKLLIYYGYKPHPVPVKKNN